MGVIQLFLMIIINFLLDRVYLGLDVSKTPLLGFLHLDHHFLNLLELLKAVCLHFFELLLLLDKHIKASFFIVAEECMLDLITFDFESILGLLFESLIKLICLLTRWWCNL